MSVGEPGNSRSNHIATYTRAASSKALSVPSRGENSVFLLLATAVLSSPARGAPSVQYTEVSPQELRLPSGPTWLSSPARGGFDRLRWAERPSQPRRALRPAPPGRPDRRLCLHRSPAGRAPCPSARQWRVRSAPAQGRTPLLFPAFSRASWVSSRTVTAVSAYPSAP